MPALGHAGRAPSRHLVRDAGPSVIAGHLEQMGTLAFTWSATPFGNEEAWASIGSEEFAEIIRQTDALNQELFAPGELVGA
jgi:hypothetical protein